MPLFSHFFVEIFVNFGVLKRGTVEMVVFLSNYVVVLLSFDIINDLIFGVLTTLSTIFQLYRGDQF